MIALFSLNGFLNVLWSTLFFALKRPDWALIEVAFSGCRLAADDRVLAICQTCELLSVALSAVGDVRRVPQLDGRPSQCAVRLSALLPGTGGHVILRHG